MNEAEISTIIQSLDSVSTSIDFLTMLVATPIGVTAAYGLHASQMKAAKLVFLMLITPMISQPGIQ